MDDRRERRAWSEPERRRWNGAAALVGAIWLSAYFVQFALNFLRAQNLLRITIGAAFALAAVGVVVWMVRTGARWRAWCALALVVAGYAAAALPLEVIQERIHLLEYGALALLLRAALAERAAADPRSGFGSRAAASCGAFALACAAGAGDELIQGILPNRVGELRDVGLNAVSAALALVGAGAVELALARDRRAADGSV